MKPSPLKGVSLGSGKTRRVSSSQAISMYTALSGSANSSQAEKAMSGAPGNNCGSWVTSTPLGGVPMRVEKPPMEAE